MTAIRCVMSRSTGWLGTRRAGQTRPRLGPDEVGRDIAETVAADGLSLPVARPWIGRQLHDASVANGRGSVLTTDGQIDIARVTEDRHEDIVEGSPLKLGAQGHTEAVGDRQMGVFDLLD